MKSAGHVAASRAHEIRLAFQLEANRMPAAVLLTGRRIAEVVLLAQSARDAGSRRIQIARVADDFRAAAAVVCHVPQGRDVDAIVARARPPALAALADELRRHR